MNPRVTVLSLLTLLAVAHVSAWPAPGWCGWQTFNTSGGLAGNDVSSILEDRSGNLWFGTGNGVSRFDGLRWNTYTIENGLADNRVLSIHEDRSGNFWFGMFNAISRFDGVHWTTYTSENTGASLYNVNSMLEDRSGSIWFATTYFGIARFDGVNWENYTYANTGFHIGSVLSMHDDRSGNLWFNTTSGVFRFDGVNWTSYPIPSIGAYDFIFLLEDHSGNLWFATSDKIIRFDGVNYGSYTSTITGISGASSALEDRSGNLWFGSNGGSVSRFDGVWWRHYTTHEGLAGDQITSMLEDRLGNLWFGVFGSGVSRFDGVSWKTYTSAGIVYMSQVTSMIKNHSGDLWASGGWSTFSALYDPRAVPPYYPPEGTWRIPNWPPPTWGVPSPGGCELYPPPTCAGPFKFEDSSWNLWLGGGATGVNRWDGSAWRLFTTADGLADNRVLAMLQDRSGNLWFGTHGGVTFTNGSTWTTFTTADGLADNHVSSMLEDRSGNLWFGTRGGVSRFDWSSWRTYTTAEGLAENDVSSILEDRSGNLWFGSNSWSPSVAGLSRFDGKNWRIYTTADGLAANNVSSMLEDRSGNLWFGSQSIGSKGAGVSRFDGNSWRIYTTLDGLAADAVSSMVEDDAGNLWFGTYNGGISRYEPDRVPPKTVFVDMPAAVSGTRSLSASFIAAYREAEQIEFSYRLDGRSWSSWSPVGAWTESGLPDGPHVLEARSRDYAGNVDPFPAQAPFFVDATPPAPVLAAPLFGSAVRGMISVRGTAADFRFATYRVEVRPSGVSTWDGSLLLTQSSSPVENDALASWDTGALPDGLYDLRLIVADTLGLVGAVQVAVLVDNHFPFADETAPAVVSSTAGGDLYTNSAELHLYFPPHAFRDDALVSIATIGAATDTLASGAVQASQAYSVSWSAPLLKHATAEFSTAGLSGGPLAVYHSADGSGWSRLGGTAAGEKISLAITAPGEYALFTDSVPAAEGAPTLSEISFTPRVFSPVRSFAQDHLAIGFTLGQSSPVTVRVYNRAGRLVREVVPGQTMPPGASLVRWDGRDRSGVPVADGIYIVTVEALGQTRKNTLAVVR